MHMSLNSILFRYVSSPNPSSFFQLDKLVCWMKYLGMWIFSRDIFLCFIHVTFSLPYMVFHNINMPQSIYVFCWQTCMPYFFAFINITIQVARYIFTRLSLGYAKWETGGSQGIQILIYQKCPSAFNWITLPIHQQHMNMSSPILGKIKFYNL